MMSEQEYTEGPLFINALTDAKKIPRNVFSFYFQPAAVGSSHIDIGPAQTDSMKGGD